MTVGVQARQLSFEVGGHRLLSSISLQVGPGRLAAIVGPSGAGKSTLLKCLCGLRRPSSGQALLDGDPAHEAGRAPERMGYVPQDDIVHGGLSVEAVLRYAAELRLGGATAAQRQHIVDQVLGLVGLADRRRLRVKRLSGGQRKRVSIAVELLAAPRVLFLDEPTSGLDPGLEQQLMRTLRELARDERSVLVTTHIMETMDVVDLLVVVYAGHLAYAGPPQRAPEFFRVDGFRAIFEALKKREPRAWAQAFDKLRDGLALPPAPRPAAEQPAVAPGSTASAAPAPVAAASDVDAQLAALKRKLEGEGA